MSPAADRHSDLSSMIRGLEPVAHAGVYVFSCVPADTDIESLDPLLVFRESEGLTLICEESRARAAGLAVAFRAAWITLEVRSDLAGVGLTAAVSQALGRADISCNVVVGVCHDHLFVPTAQRDAALEALRALQASETATEQAPRRSSGRAGNGR